MLHLFTGQSGKLQNTIRPFFFDQKCQICFTSNLDDIHSTHFSSKHLREYGSNPLGGDTGSWAESGKWSPISPLTISPLAIFRWGWAVSTEMHLVQGTRDRENGTQKPTTIRHLAFDTRFQNLPFTHCSLLFHLLYFFGVHWVWFFLFVFLSSKKVCIDFFSEIRANLKITAIFVLKSSYF